MLYLEYNKMKGGMQRGKSIQSRYRCAVEAILCYYEKTISLLLLVVLAMSVFSITVNAVDDITTGSMVDESVEQKVYCNATIEDNFAENRIMVVMSNEASLEFKDFEQSDFAGIGCAGVRDLSCGSKQKVKGRYEDLVVAAKSRTAVPETVDKERISNYNQVLCLELEESGKENVLAAIEELQKREDVIYAGPDYVISICSTVSNDTYYEDQWAIESIQLPDAWDITTGSTSVKVGVIDTGINANHADLTGRVSVSLSADFTSGARETGVSVDPNGHGTHVAGIIGATCNNDEGIAGVCWNVTLISLRVFDLNGDGYSSAVASAIDYADSLDIPILNLSAAWDLADEELAELYDYALKSKIEDFSGLLICSAGNSGSNNDEGTVYPANYNLFNMITVGACDSDDEPWEVDVTIEEETHHYESNFGAETVDIYAPGADILSCYIVKKSEAELPIGLEDESIYHYSSGTSMAAPFVTGVAALMLSANSSLTPSEIKSIILMSCDKINGLTNLCVSGGKLNAYKAVANANIYTVISPDSSATVRITRGEYQWYKFTATSSGWVFFYTEYTNSQLDMKGELFYELVADDSIEGRIVYEEDIYEADDGLDPDENFYMMVCLTAGQTVYLRVSTHDSGGTYILKIETD